MLSGEQTKEILHNNELDANHSNCRSNVTGDSKKYPKQIMIFNCYLLVTLFGFLIVYFYR